MKKQVIMAVLGLTALEVANLNANDINALYDTAKGITIDNAYSGDEWGF